MPVSEQTSHFYLQIYIKKIIIKYILWSVKIKNIMSCYFEKTALHCRVFCFYVEEAFTFIKIIFTFLKCRLLLLSGSLVSPTRVT